MLATTKPDKPGYTRVEVRGVVLAKGSPRHRVTGNCRPKTEILCCCGWCCWRVDKMFCTDTRCNNEGKKRWNPSTIFIPKPGQENSVVAFSRGDNAHQLRTLSPQKDTCSRNQSEIIGTQYTLLTNRDISEMIKIPTLSKSVRFMVTWHTEQRTSS